MVLLGARAAVLFLVAAFLLLRTGRNLSLRWWRAAATPRVSRPSRPCDVGRVCLDLWLWPVSRPGRCVLLPFAARAWAARPCTLLRARSATAPEAEADAEVEAEEAQTEAEAEAGPGPESGEGGAGGSEAAGDVP